SDQLLNRRALNRKETNQVLGRRQWHDVLDPFIVGKRGLVRGNRRQVVGRCRHVRVVRSKKKTARHLCSGGSWGFARCVRLAVPLRQKARKEKVKAVVPANHGWIQPRSVPDWQITP